MLRYPIYVRSVTNLSDARYCAGMGVEMLGFCFDPSSRDLIEENIFHGITGWLSGIKVVAELNKTPLSNASQIINDIKPDYVLVDGSDAEYEQLTDAQVIYKIVLDRMISQYPPEGSLVLLEANNENLKLTDYKDILGAFVIIYDYKLILSFGFNKDNMEKISEAHNLYGFSLRGGNEISPGLKSFDELADILEAIEVLKHIIEYII